MGGAEPPYTVAVVNLSDAPKEVIDEVLRLITVIRDARRVRMARIGVAIDVSKSAPEFSNWPQAGREPAHRKR
jgi:hypothetical protein